MKFHSTPAAGHAGGTAPAASRVVLARMRASARLAALVLLIFVMKIGAAVACVKHDFVDLSLGTKGSLVAVDKVPTDDGTGALTKGSSGSCSHCSCRHAAVMALETPFSFLVVSQGVAVLLAGVPPSVQSRLELRPPIA